MNPVLALLTAVLPVSLDDRILVDPRTQIPIVCKIEPEMFPTSWRAEPINARAVELAENEVERSKLLVKKALDAYPVPVLKRSLRKVYISKSIEFYGLGYGGTNSTDAVYLANDGIPQGYTDAYLVGSFHHELSSIFLRNFPSYLDQKAWNAALPKDFKYRGDGTQSLREGTASTDHRPEFQAQGFLAQYATSSQEEDFNMTAEALFTNRPDFWAAQAKYPALKTKVGLVIAFYNRLDPQFTETYFRNLAQVTPDKSGQNRPDGR